MYAVPMDTIPMHTVPMYAIPSGRVGACREELAGELSRACRLGGRGVDGVSHIQIPSTRAGVREREGGCHQPVFHLVRVKIWLGLEEESHSPSGDR